MFKTNKCKRCESKLKEAYSFCPSCGLDLRNIQKEMQDFGMLGKNDEVFGAPLVGGLGGLGISERMINSLIKGLTKSIESQMKNIDSENEEKTRTDIKRFPNGISIRMGTLPLPKEQKKKQVKKFITEEQIKRMSKLPRKDTKADVRRFSDKIVYEAKTPDVENIEDIFISKLETGYEVKAIGKKKVYVVNIPINLPIKKYSLKSRNLNVEFGLQ
jgi:hypothetical protein